MRDVLVDEWIKRIWLELISIDMSVSWHATHFNHTHSTYNVALNILSVCVISGAYEPPKAARSVQLRRTAFAFTRI